MDESKTLLSFLAAFDAAVTDAVDSFKFILRKLKVEKFYIHEKEVVVKQVAHR